MSIVETSPPSKRCLLDCCLLMMRIIVGIIFVIHGASKMGFMGGGTLAGTVEKMGLGPLGYLVAIGEFFGGIGIIVGLLARFSALSNFMIMCGAIFLVHGKNGFHLSKAGYEYNLALIGLLLPIVLLGPGRMAIGRFLPLPKSASGATIMPLE